MNDHRYCEVVFTPKAEKAMQAVPLAKRAQLLNFPADYPALQVGDFVDGGFAWLRVVARLHRAGDALPPQLHVLLALLEEEAKQALAQYLAAGAD